jgi:signal transduction histidine kinase
VRRAQAAAEVVTERRLLALDALSKLTAQFAGQMDPHRLVEACILTLTGQFAVSEAFAALRHPSSTTDRTLYYATGRFRHHPVLRFLGQSLDGIQALVESGYPHTIDKLADRPVDVELVTTLRTAKVRLVIPLIHEGTLAGLIGLGDKVNRKTFDRTEIDLLATVAGTLTPLLMNSFLFAEIDGLKAWYLEILNSVKQAVFVFDDEERLKKVNAEGVKLRGAFDLASVPSGLSVGLTLAECFPRPNCPDWVARIRQARRAEHDRPLENLVAHTPAGKSTFSARVSAVRRASETTGDFIVTLEDVTQQKEGERRVFELQKLAEQGVMVASIAHELNNILGVIGGAAELAELALRQQDHDRLQRFMAKVKAGVERMDRFTSGLTDSTRLHSVKTLQNLNAVISDVLSYVPLQARFTDVELEVELAPELPMLPLDGDQVTQLLLNLLNNAADAIHESEHRPGRVQVQTSWGPSGVQLVIADNGNGIQPEARRRLFRDRFTTKASGHGYGLVTCAQIVASHDGKIEVESEAGQGARFSISFPVSNSTAAHHGAPEGSEPTIP